jgi:hypothetical protein
MPAAKNYFQDRIVLLLLSINAFLTLLATLSVLFRLQGAGTNGFIVQYRANVGISGFKTGSILSLVSFIGFAILVFAANTVLSMRTYHIRKQLAVVILGLGTLLLVINIIVGNALLILR